MTDVQMTFKRYELKYLLTRKQAGALRAAMRGHMAIDRFGHSTIRNIYFDTDREQWIVYKNKADGTRAIRLRTTDEAAAAITGMFDNKFGEE